MPPARWAQLAKAGASPIAIPATPDSRLRLGLATATTSAAFLPHFEQRIRSASSFSVTDQPTRRARASGSISRHAPQSQMTRIRNWPKQWDGRPHPLDGIDVPKWKCLTTT